MKSSEARGRFQAVDVVPLMDDVLGELESLCRNRCVSVKIVGRSTEPHAAACPEKLRRLFRLVLAYVVETTEPNAEVEILLRRVQVSLMVCVRDQLPVAGGPSHGASESTASQADGNGCCCDDPQGKLAECREIVAGHGGEMWAWKTLAGGTAVCFDLPIRISAADEGYHAAPTAAGFPLVDPPTEPCPTSI